MTKVNIIIPYKNNLKLLFISLKSVLNQTFKNYKVIIIYDDKDKTDLKRIRKFIITKKKKFKNIIKIVVNDKNLGAGRSRNIGIEISNSKFVAFLDSDDYWYKNKLKYQIQFMERHKILVTHTSYNIINESEKKKSYRQARKKLYFKDILNSCDIGLSTVIINLNFLKKNRLRFPKIKTKEDYVLWLRILKKIKYITGINKKLSSYRKTKNSLSSNMTRNIINGFLVYRIYLKMGYLESFYRLMILSLNFIKKKILYDIK